MIPISGWTFPAEVVTYPTGAIVVVVNEGALMVEIASRTLDRAQLLAIAASIHVRDNGGVDLDASTVPADFKPMGEDTMLMEPGAYLSYGFPSGEGAILGLSVMAQTSAGRAFDRIVEPPVATARVGDKTADVYTELGMFALVWLAAPGVQVRVDVVGAFGGQNEPLALRAARSIRTVDEATWRKVLDTEIERDDTSVTTTAAGTDTIVGGGPATTR
jgi:hypothetical protein